MTGAESGGPEREALKTRGERRKTAPVGTGGREEASLEPGTDGRPAAQRPQSRGPKHTMTVGSWRRTSGSI